MRLSSSRGASRAPLTPYEDGDRSVQASVTGMSGRPGVFVERHRDHLLECPARRHGDRAHADGVPGVDSQSSPPSAAPVSASAALDGSGRCRHRGRHRGIGLAPNVGRRVRRRRNQQRCRHRSLRRIVRLDGRRPVSHRRLLAAQFRGRLRPGDDVALRHVDERRHDVVLRTCHRHVQPLPGPELSGQLDLLLTSEASAGFPQRAPATDPAFGLATVTSAVPLPAPWLLLLAGLGPLAAVKRRVGRVLNKVA